MEKAFPNNLNSLRLVNTVVIFLAFTFAAFPFFVESNIFKTSFYLAAALFALILGFVIKFKDSRRKQGEKIKNGFIYALIIAYYANAIFFGIYLGVWANLGKLAVSFMVILLCALVLLNTSPILNLCLTISAMLLFMAATIFVKAPQDWSLDVTNALFAGIVGLFINWRVTMYRMSMLTAAIKLEAESTTDTLTGLKNRRDFTQTFQRFISNYRQSDIYLCIAILDIDFFKNYNDHYGHPQGDECLRSIGAMLNQLRDIIGVYTARVGGEEFAMIWFDREASNANNVASLVNQMVRNLNIPHEKSSIAPYVTVSLGIHITLCSASKDMQTLYDLADKALYTAKSEGRNRAVITS